MEIAAVVATDLNNAIGKNNQLLWRLPADLKFFKETTMGSPVVMGRKTYDSIGRLLPGRKNIIITRNQNFRVEGAEVYPSIEAAIKNVSDQKVFIIGGAEIYKLAMPFTKVIYRTLVKSKFAADTFIEPIDEQIFKMVWEECHLADEKNGYDYCFQKWERTSS
jgi:dihydrofolate reductase